MPAVLHQRRHLVAVGVEHPNPGAQRRVQPHRRQIGALVRQRIPHDHRAVDGAGQQGERVVARRPAQFPCVTPAGQQVEIHLVGFRAGDRVVVCAVGELHPRLGQGGLRIGGPGQQAGEHREALGVQHGVLGGPVGLLGVDIGDVLAGVDGIHVPGLRRGLDTTLIEFGPHRSEKLTGKRTYELRPRVARIPVAMDLGDPLVRRRVVGADRQQHVARQRDLLQPGEQAIRRLLRLGQRG